MKIIRWLSRLLPDPDCTCRIGRFGNPRHCPVHGPGPRPRPTDPVTIRQRRT